MITSFKWWFVRVSSRHYYQCFWRINFSNSFCIQSHLFINISSSSSSKTLLSFDLNRSINSIFHLIHKFVSIWKWTFQSNFLFFSQILIKTNNFSFKYQNISNFRWNSCQHDSMTIHLNNNYHVVFFFIRTIKTIDTSLFSHQQEICSTNFENFNLFFFRFCLLFSILTFKHYSLYHFKSFWLNSHYQSFALRMKFLISLIQLNEFIFQIYQLNLQSTTL